MGIMEALVGSEGERRVKCLLLADDDQTLITDTGPGICSELREAIFRQGFSTKGEHRGLGLALVKELVDLSGGGSTWSRMRADGVHHRRRGRSARCSRFTS